MFKKVNNWHLSILVIIVSIFSVALIQEYALAAWQEPSAAPGSVTNKNIVLNPMTVDLDLDDNRITGDNIIIDPDSLDTISIDNDANTARLCLNEVCKSTWPVDPSDPVWNTNVNGVDIDYITGNIGVGIALPTELFHIDGGNMLVTNGNINLGSSASLKATNSAGDNPSVIYLNPGDDVLNIAGDDIRFNDLSGNNLIYLQDLGSIANLGIGTATPNKSLHIKTPTGVNAEINLESGINTHWGMYQDEVTADLRFWHNDDVVVFDSTGNVEVTGNVKGASATVTGNITAGNATFNGDVRVTTGYIQFPVVTVDPPSADCNSVLDRGKTVFNSTTGELIICNFHQNIRDWDHYERTVALP